MRALALCLSMALTLLASEAWAEEDCRAGFAQWDLEDLLIEAFEALGQPDDAESSHCAFQLDLPGMTVPDTGAELGSCRWQGVDDETDFVITADAPDLVSVLRRGEVLALLDLCDV